MEISQEKYAADLKEQYNIGRAKGRLETVSRVLELLFKKIKTIELENAEEIVKTLISESTKKDE